MIWIMASVLVNSLMQLDQSLALLSSPITKIPRMLTHVAPSEPHLAMSQ